MVIEVDPNSSSKWLLFAGPPKRILRSVNATLWATILLLAVIWGVPYFLIKVALAELSPACVAWGRVTLGALVLLPLAWRQGALRGLTAHWRPVLAFALIEVVGPFLLIASGERWISSSLTAILVATAPLMVVVLAPLFGDAERPTPTRWLGFALGFLGVVALVGIEVDGGSRPLLGALLVLLASIGYSIGPLIAQHHLKQVKPLGLIAVSLAISSVVLATPAFLTAPASLPSWKALGAVATLGWLCSAIALVLFVTVIAKAGASRASVIAYLAPTVAVLLGVVALDEPFGISTLVGMAMIFGGSWMATGRAPATGIRKQETGSAPGHEPAGSES